MFLSAGGMFLLSTYKHTHSNNRTSKVSVESGFVESVRWHLLRPVLPVLREGLEVARCLEIVIVVNQELKG